MQLAFQIIVSVAVIACFAWMLVTAGKSARTGIAIDPSNPNQIGTLIGLMGGSIQDAAIAQHALRQFEQQHGRKATQGDMGAVAGIMRSMK